MRGGLTNEHKIKIASVESPQPDKYSQLKHLVRRGRVQTLRYFPNVRVPKGTEYSECRNTRGDESSESKSQAHLRPAQQTKATVRLKCDQSGLKLEHIQSSRARMTSILGRFDFGGIHLDYEVHIQADAQHTQSWHGIGCSTTSEFYQSICELKCIQSCR